LIGGWRCRSCWRPPRGLLPWLNVAQLNIGRLPRRPAEASARYHHPQGPSVRFVLRHTLLSQSGQDSDGNRRDRPTLPLRLSRNAGHSA
jgi:hypothetical protein